MNITAITVYTYLIVVNSIIAIGALLVWLRLRYLRELKYFTFLAGGTVIAHVVEALGMAMVLAFQNQTAGYVSILFFIPGEFIKMIFWGMLAGYTGGLLDGVKPVEGINNMATTANEAKARGDKKPKPPTYETSFT